MNQYGIEKLFIAYDMSEERRKSSQVRKRQKSKHPQISINRVICADFARMTVYYFHTITMLNAIKLSMDKQQRQFILK